MSTIDMIVLPSDACWLCSPLRAILPLGRIRCLPGLDLAVAVDAVDLTVLDRVMPPAAVEVDLTVLDLATGPSAGALPDLMVLARDAGR
jgi:hypothetical protein